MTFDWHMLYPLHTVILDNSQVFGGVPCKAQLCNFSKWFFSPRFGVVPIWELWQFCCLRIGPPKIDQGEATTLFLYAKASDRSWERTVRIVFEAVPKRHVLSKRTYVPDSKIPDSEWTAITTNDFEKQDIHAYHTLYKCLLTIAHFRLTHAHTSRPRTLSNALATFCSWKEKGNSKDKLNFGESTFKHSNEELNWRGGADDQCYYNAQGTAKEKGKGKGVGKGKGKVPYGDPKIKFKGTIQCKFCARTGHYTDKCWYYKNAQDRRAKKQKEKEAAQADPKANPQAAKRQRRRPRQRQRGWW